MNRKLLWAVFAIGLALVIAPLALGLPGKAAAGQRMLNGFQPIMQPTQVATTARYYNDVFVPLGTVTPVMSAQNLANFAPVEIVASRIDAMLAFDRSNELARIKTPTLVVGAEDDIVTPAYFSEELARLIPAAEVKLFPRGGHFLVHVRAREFANC